MKQSVSVSSREVIWAICDATLCMSGPAGVLMERGNNPQQVMRMSGKVASI